MCCGYFSAGPVCGCVLAAFSMSRALTVQISQEMDVKDSSGRRRRDSWDNPVDDSRPGPHNGGPPMDDWDMEEDKNGGGIGKIKISREMKEKLEALTSTSTPARYILEILKLIVNHDQRSPSFSNNYLLLIISPK